MQEDAIKWNQKHLEHPMPQTPSDLLIHFLPLLVSKPSKKALDLACGNGRNAKFLAQNGFVCDAIDISKVALAMCENIEGVSTFCQDLDHFRPLPSSYDVVLNFYFLNRDLLPLLAKALKPKGIFLLETFIRGDNGENSSKIADEKILYQGELESIFLDFHILHRQISTTLRREGQEAKIISFVAQKP